MKQKQIGERIEIVIIMEDLDIWQGTVGIEGWETELGMTEDQNTDKD